jgi:hypothetical protein
MAHSKRTGKCHPTTDGISSKKSWVCVCKAPRVPDTTKNQHPAWDPPDPAPLQREQRHCQAICQIFVAMCLVMREVTLDMNDMNWVWQTTKRRSEEE